MRSSQLFAVVVALLPALSAAVPAGTSSRASSLKAASSKAASSKAASTRAASTSKSVAAAAAGASAVPPVGSNGTTGTIQVSDTQIANAVASWMTDTGKVTKFLDTATSFTGDEFTRQATIALNAEKDELNHKNILDAAMGMQPDVQAANNVLEMQGTFQMVVDTLQKMVSQGPDTAQADVDSINKNRCVNV